MNESNSTQNNLSDTLTNQVNNNLICEDVVIHKFKIILIALLSIIILFTIAISIYYRYFLRRFGFEPFSIPSFCPEIIFPRKEYDPLLRKTVDKNLEMIFVD